MSGSRYRLIALTALVVLVPSAALAGLVGVEPDDFAAGTDISSAFTGVTLSTGAGGSVYSATAAEISGQRVASTGTRAFHFAATVTYGQWFEDNAARTFRADFAVPTDFVSLAFIGNNGFDVGNLRAYDAAGTLLETYFVNGLDDNGLQLGEVEVASITRGVADIAYITAGGSSSNELGLDGFEFNQIPVPGAAVLGVLGLGLLASQRRI